ncbi:hypothetical protein AAZV13_05G060600 [Glycine max]
MAESNLHTVFQIPQEYSSSSYIGALSATRLPMTHISSYFRKPNVILSEKSKNYTKFPSFDDLEQNPDSGYLCICAMRHFMGLSFRNTMFLRVVFWLLICLQISSPTQWMGQNLGLSLLDWPSDSQ